MSVTISTLSGITQLTGDVTAGPGSGSQATTIAANAVTDGKLRQGAATSVIGRSANTTGNVADVTAGSDGLVLMRRTGALLFASVLNTEVGAATLANSRMSAMPTLTIKGNNTGGSNVPIDLTVAQTTAILNTMVGDSGAGGAKGLVPAQASGDAAAGKFLKADATWAIPNGGLSYNIATVVGYAPTASGVWSTMGLTITTPNVAGAFYLLNGYVNFNENASNPGYNSLQLIWATADGANIGTQPTAVTPTAGLNSRSQFIWASGSAELWQASAKPIVVAANTTVFLVPRADMTTFGQARYDGQITVTRAS